jgi:hypothetical protein
MRVFPKKLLNKLLIFNFRSFTCEQCIFTYKYHEHSSSVPSFHKLHASDTHYKLQTNEIKKLRSNYKIILTINIFIIISSISGSYSNREKVIEVESKMNETKEEEEDEEAVDEK